MWVHFNCYRSHMAMRRKTIWRRNLFSSKMKNSSVETVWQTFLTSNTHKPLWPKMFRDFSLQLTKSFVKEERNFLRLAKGWESKEEFFLKIIVRKVFWGKLHNWLCWRYSLLIEKQELTLVNKLRNEEGK